jgi:hypothetical protein
VPDRPAFPAVVRTGGRVAAMEHLTRATSCSDAQYVPRHEFRTGRPKRAENYGSVLDAMLTPRRLTPMPRIRVRC